MGGGFRSFARGTTLWVLSIKTTIGRPFNIYFARASLFISENNPPLFYALNFNEEKYVHPSMHSPVYN